MKKFIYVPRILFKYIWNMCNWYIQWMAGTLASLSMVKSWPESAQITDLQVIQSTLILMWHRSNVFYMIHSHQCMYICPQRFHKLCRNLSHQITWSLILLTQPMDFVTISLKTAGADFIPKFDTVKLISFSWALFYLRQHRTTAMKLSSRED